ncbi:MAG TPA: anti-sigma factor [Candidatus Cybelea sp.]|jgi:mycothiol system anti-sigma-R factor|nr:anti-sigma factor [Candidatus Cybelea sp.]
MSCDFSGTLLHAYLDSELDAVRAAEFERHLENCRECTASLGAVESLRASLQRAQLYETAPPELREKIRSKLKISAASTSRSPVAAWRWLAAAAAILLVTGVAWFAVPHFGADNPESVTSAEVIDAHIRSLQAGHLTDVTSTDQHTVKPWFDGKLDFIPPVHDFMDEGFPLIGGRLDVLGQRNVAALVYGRRKHFINVFVWPTKDRDTPIHPPGSRQGYQWVHWRHQGMEFCAVSDVSAEDLHELAQLFIQ